MLFTCKDLSVQTTAHAKEVELTPPLAEKKSKSIFSTVFVSKQLKSKLVEPVIPLAKFRTTILLCRIPGGGAFSSFKSVRSNNRIGRKDRSLSSSFLLLIYGCLLGDELQKYSLYFTYFISPVHVTHRVLVANCKLAPWQISRSDSQLELAYANCSSCSQRLVDSCKGVRTVMFSNFWIT